MTTSSTPSTLYLLLKTDRIVCQITGVASVSQEDVEFYDGSTHSQIVDAAMLGNAHLQTTVLEPAENIHPAATYGYAALAGGAVTSQPAVPYRSFIQSHDSIEDTGFVLNTTPGQTAKKDTMIKWWSGAGASGNLVAWAWKSQIRYCGPVAPTLLA